MNHLIDIMDLSVQEIDELILTAKDIIANPAKYQEKCRYKKLATLFFEPSTRTRLSFEAAMMELGGNVLGFSDAGSSSSTKGESVSDTVSVVSGYADIIAMRHPKEGAPYVASKNATIPVINAGDGGHCHPTQTLADLFTIYREKGRLSGLTVGFCGDLKYGRTVHIYHSDNPRLFNIPPRDSKQWKKEYDRRTSVERSNKREKEDYKLEDGRHRSTKMWYCRLYGIMMLQHLDAWETPPVGEFQKSLLSLTA